MKKIIISLGIMLLVGGVVIGATNAFFSDSAVSTGNVFTAGTLELKLAAANVSGNPTGGWQDTLASTWNFTNMAPGETPDQSILWLKNNGSVDGKSIDLALASTENVSGFENQVRITQLDLDGETLLTGGAGAVIPDYVAPTNCTIYVNPGTYAKVNLALNAAVNGDVICVGPGNYTNTYEGGLVNIDKKVTIASTDGPAATTISAGITVASDNVTIEGFTISKTGITSGAYSYLTIKNNIITDINSANSTVYGVVVAPGNTSISNIVIENNQINDLHYIGVSDPGHSVAGIAVGWSIGTGVISDVQIQNNSIANITSNTSAWRVGHGAYGILINYGSDNVGYVTGLSVEHNTITKLEGLWSHAIGLETNTHNTSVTFNDISNIVDHKSPSDAIAVFLETNPNGGTVTVHQNNFSSDVTWGVGMAANASGAVDAQNNWWSDFDPSDQVFVLGSGSIDTTNYAGNAFVGFINGNDQNSNGYADMQDLRLDPIVGTSIDFISGAEKSLVMSVQIDGPTTDNTYQGANLTTDITVTLQQQ